jgi:hypothetical protein
MRFVLPLAVILSLAALGGFAADDHHPTPPPPADPASGPTAAADGDAAARHARRTACIKEAKAKKLVGPQKAAFIKECVAAS